MNNKFLKKILMENDDKYFKYFYKEQFINNSKFGGGIIYNIKRTYYKFKMSRISRLYNCYIPSSAIIKEKPTFPHSLYGIFISAGAKIGKNCVIFQQVTIGSNTLKDSKNKGFPIIGDNVFIGAGAMIIGNVKIGNNVRVGANTTITKDIPDNSTVVSADVKIFSNKPRINEFVGYNDYVNDNKYNSNSKDK